MKKLSIGIILHNDVFSVVHLHVKRQAVQVVWSSLTYGHDLVNSTLKRPNLSNIYEVFKDFLIVIRDLFRN